MAFPVDPLIPQIVSALAENDSLLLTAEPGAGKTTRVPLALLQAEWLAGKKIIMLEPRRLAVRNAARFMASQLGEAAGETVGYRIRLESRESASTRILVVTEGILTRMLQQDPELAGIGLIIFDEFHERHLHSDLALALAHQCQQVWRDDLKLLVMSATLDTDALGAKLEAPLIHCPGRGFPVTTEYRPARSQDERLPQHVNRVVQEALQQTSGHILVFLPGVGDIQRCQQLLEERLTDDCLVLPLHGQLNDQQQKAALAPVSESQRKILLATNIAESSLTLDGVDCVIDSGLERRLQFNPSNGLSQLHTRQICLASATQRMGRAGRQRAGHCFRLWSESSHHTRPDHIEAEILQADLGQLTLELLQWGANAGELLWLTPPPDASMAAASRLLIELGLATLMEDQQLQLTEQGHQAVQFGMEARWAAVMASTDQRTDVAYLAAMLQEWPHRQSRTDDIERRWNWARQQGFWQQRVKPLAQRWLKGQLQQPLCSSTDLSLLALMAFPDRLARKRSNQNGSYQLVTGTGVQLQPDSDLPGADWLVAIDIQGDRIRAALEISEQTISQVLQQQPQRLQQQVVIEWQSSGALLAERQQRLGQLVWRREKIQTMTSEDWQQAWLDYFGRNNPNSSKGLQRLHQLDWNPAAESLRGRIRLAADSGLACPDGENWPDVSDQGLLANLEHWLLPYLTDCRNEKQLRQLNIETLLHNWLGWAGQQALDQLVPTHWTVPSGSRIRIDYSENPPVLPVKLQEMFGEPTQPAILNGQLQLMIHLLSPGKKPLQITRDLPHFWANGYAEVRKEMRGRYPKHPWPEDPLGAEATALTKRALQRRDN